MFVADTSADFTALLQGDVVKDVPLVAVLDLSLVQGVGNVAWSYPMALKLGPCVVLSHSCEIAKANGEKVTSCLLAPLRPADRATTPDLFEILKSNTVEEGKPNFIKYFFVPPTEKLPNANGSLVDFSKLFSVRKTSIEYLIERKVLEMTVEHRRLLARKTALYFYRGTGDDTEVPPPASGGVPAASSVPAAPPPAAPPPAAPPPAAPNPAVPSPAPPASLKG